jgi:regulator of replication initiation timing
MNKKDIKELMTSLEGLKGLSPIVEETKNLVIEREKIKKFILQLETFVEPLERISDEQRDKFDNMSERTQESYKGELQGQLADNLERAFEALRDSISYLEYSIAD